MPSYKILIIEDEKQIARFIELELKHEGYDVYVCYDGKEGLKKVEEIHPDLILLDIMLPGINGIEICRKIRQHSNVPIIMVTAKDDIPDRVMGLDSGADDYVTKPFAIEELLARIRAALRKSKQLNIIREILTIADLTIDTSKRIVKRADKIIELTKREYDLLEYLVRNKGIVLTRDQILENVWGYSYMGDTNVVDVYIRYLRSKVDDGFKTKLIHTVRGVGYKCEERENED
ncbi:two component transcriptional regulator, winged helix family [Caldicellulosiruptor acetigenus I77R1B]|uniref:Two component transcriptional regulator, winged helix family n=1 Tax=Caldicellulosiruptor acetigenus (strain ATCC 700853 / DSM 12137 / I77R1B) TaxID=632335 RepID=E4S7H3_CALA7|nr:response regulator transcription factor [Caldicellulosiruptor acetigenus]ADQ39818.1 two component transcriptional regulator, winged helix family [Caldicellulosiruptor acetigenus I77R1B]